MKTHLILLLTAAVLVVGCIDFEGDEPSPVNPDDTVIVNPIDESTFETTIVPATSPAGNPYNFCGTDLCC